MKIVTDNPFYHLLNNKGIPTDKLLNAYEDAIFIHLIADMQAQGLQAELLEKRLEQSQESYSSSLHILLNFVGAANLAYYAFKTGSALQAHYWEQMQALNDKLIQGLAQREHQVRWLQVLGRAYHSIDHYLAAEKVYQQAIALEKNELAELKQQQQATITQTLHDILLDFADLSLKQGRLAQKKAPQLAKQYFATVQQAASQALTYTESQDKAKLYYFLVQAHYYLAKGCSSDKLEAINNYFSAIKVGIAGYKISKLNKSLYLTAIQTCYKELQTNSYG